MVIGIILYSLHLIDSVILFFCTALSSRLCSLRLSSPRNIVPVTPLSASYPPSRRPKASRCTPSGSPRIAAFPSPSLETPPGSPSRGTGRLSPGFHTPSFLSLLSVSQGTYRLSTVLPSTPCRLFPQQGQFSGSSRIVSFISPVSFNPCLVCPGCPPGFFPLFFLNDFGEGFL